MSRREMGTKLLQSNTEMGLRAFSGIRYGSIPFCGKYLKGMTQEVTIPVTLRFRKDSEKFLISRRKYVLACKY